MLRWRVLATKYFEGFILYNPSPKFILFIFKVVYIIYITFAYILELLLFNYFIFIIFSNDKKWISP